MTKLVKLLAAVDANSSVTLEFPPQVAPGANFQVKAQIRGGAGPVVGVVRVDRDHRWYARPASSAGWRVATPPRITGQRQRHAEEPGKDDDLQHVAFRHRLHRVGRKEIDQCLRE